MGTNSASVTSMNRGKRMVITLSEDELDAIYAAAEAMSLPPATWVRVVAMKAAKEKKP